MIDGPVLVTGASGFIGSHVVTRLRQENCSVHVLARSLALSSGSTARGCRVFPGDVTVPESLSRAIAGCRYVVHCAVGGSDIVHARAINVDGTRHLLEAAQAGGIHRVVHLSSVVAHGRRWPPVLTEAAPLQSAGDPYVVTKAESERVALDFARHSGVEVTIVRPTIVYGPASGRIVTDLQRVRLERVRLIDDGCGILNAIYVDDLVEGILLALRTPDARNEAYLLSGSEITQWRAYYTHLAQMCGKPAPRGIGRHRARAAAGWSKWRFRFTRRPEVFDAGDFALMTQPGRVSIEKASRTLGFRPRVSLEDGMRRTERWLRERGYLPRAA